jgi:hypothetical protein
MAKVGDFGKDTTIQKRLNKIIEDLAKKPQNDSLERFVDKLEDVRNGKEDYKIKPLPVFLDVIEVIKDGTASTTSYESMLQRAEAIYDDLFILGPDTPNFEYNMAIYKSLIRENDMVLRDYFDLSLYYTFSEKKNYLTLIQAIAPMKNARQIFEKVRGHAMNVRELLIDDYAYMTHLLKVTEMLGQISPEDYDKALESELSRMRRNNGIYDVDPVRLAQVEKNVHEAALTIESGKNILEMLDRKCQSIERLTAELDGKAQEICRATQTFLETTAENAKSSVENSIKEYEEGQKKAAYLEKEIFLKQVFSDAESEITKYQSRAKAIAATASADIASFSKNADSVIKRLKNAMENDDTIKRFAEGARSDEELLEKIQRLAILNDSMIERLGKEAFGDDGDGFDGQRRGEGRRGVPGEELPMPGGQSDHGEPPMPPHGPHDPHGPHGRRPSLPIPAVNPLLDRRVPFKERFAIVMKEKERRMAEGELFHETFDDVITAIMEDVNPYLIGPSGCGKTYMVKQIGELLNIECTDIGYINEEYDILGYVTAMGDYSESNFYRLYKYGGIAFCDELDNGNAKATVKLNSFLTNQEDAYYFFPGGERVDKHKNFRVIAAGNTDGSGADINYNTRERIEESVQQRMIPIYVDYDNRVEKEILKDYPDWFEFGCYFRKATSRWGEVSGMPAQGIFTTRDAFRVRQYLDNGSFMPRNIIKYEFIQTKEPEYLGFLEEEISKLLKAEKKTNKIYSLFAQEVEEIRKRGKRT